MRVSEFFGGLFTGLFNLVHRVVQPCSVSEIPVFMQVSEFFERVVHRVVRLRLSILRM